MPAPQSPVSAETVMSFIATHPPIIYTLGALILILAIRSALRGRKLPTDPTRMFTAAQRAEGFTRANNRCELEGWWLTRCKKSAHHGDHHYPWSKGGATSMGNFVAACARCNTSKGAKIAGFLTTQRLEARRRRYFPDGVSVRAGDKFVQR